MQTTAIRALGRLERRDVVPILLPFVTGVNSDVAQREAITAVAQAMRGAPLANDGGGDQVESVLTVFLGAAAAERSPLVVSSFARAFGRLPYERADQVRRAETILTAMLELRSSQLQVRLREPEDAATVMVAGAGGLELLARTQRAEYRADERTTELLRSIASAAGGTVGTMHGMRAARLPAFRALIAAAGVDDHTLRPNVTFVQSDAIRHLAMQLLAGAASPITGAERADLLRQGSSDPWFQVRLEALRGYVRHQTPTDGCVLVLQALDDPSEHVVLAALDALGAACPGDEDVLRRLIAEAAAPPALGNWRPASHALVSLARRSADHAQPALVSHSRHTTWQVRMYAARAAAIVADAGILERLAFDEHDNVREAALAPLKQLKKDAAEPAFLAALARRDYQLLRAAARELAGMRVTRSLSDALVEALIRVTAERRETSRDTRLALVERLGEFGGDRYTERLRPLLRDFDERVAAAVAATLAAWTGQGFTIDPQPLPAPPLPSSLELERLRSQVAVLVMESGREIEIRLDVERAPLTSTRFLRLANADYYDGLTFHRVVPTFVVQGGSPGANEYMGDGPYLRDEISARSHTRGTVGLSTRGRDTGDAQFFINLVDNRRLDFDYTVFGAVTASSLPRIDEIQEGDRIADVRFRNPVR